MDEVADVADAGFHNLADLLVAEIDDKLQPHGLSLFRRQFIDHAVKHGRGLTGFHVFTGARIWVCFEVEDFSVHGDEAVIFAVVVERSVLAGGEEPGGEA